MEHLGSCLCRKVKYRVTGSFDGFYLCHCRYCQKGTGSAHGANLFSNAGQLQWLKGEHEVRRYQPPRSRHVKAFCKNCGAALPNLQMDGKVLVVPAGSLDTALTKRPDGHIFAAHKAEWEESLEKVPYYPILPE
ncbi:GFA family protein [Carboxylicivirga taeanensis]|uniref:GFA family protein n=1 Tax=Carboxylicivirga taeanensis TaxID=1416875 RepID=UPI003F6E3BA2